MKLVEILKTKQCIRVEEERTDNPLKMLKTCLRNFFEGVQYWLYKGNTFIPSRKTLTNKLVLHNKQERSNWTIDQMLIYELVMNINWIRNVIFAKL